MDSQNYLQNNFGPVQQPVTVIQGQGMTSMPAMPAAPQFIPIMVPQQPVTITVYEDISDNDNFYIYTPNGMVSATPSQYLNQHNGKYVAPAGWSFIPTNEFFSYNLNMTPFPNHVEPLTPSNTPSVASQSQERVLASQNLNVQEPAVEAQVKNKINVAAKKRPHRAKQQKIEKIHNIVKDKCIEQGIFADDKEVLRGEDVLRIHVKTWEGLDLIEECLEEVEQSDVMVDRIALPISMKNQFQKKGFICYLKVVEIWMVEIVKEIFAQYPVAFKKCDVALPSKKESFSQSKVIFPVDFGMAPPTMKKRLSAA